MVFTSDCCRCRDEMLICVFGALGSCMARLLCLAREDESAHDADHGLEA